MDVLTHAVEAYTCNKATPLSDMCALTAIELVQRHLVDAVGTVMTRKHARE